MSLTFKSWTVHYCLAFEIYISITVQQLTFLTHPVLAYLLCRMFETNPEVKRTFEKFRQLDTSTELWRSTVLETHGMVVMCPSVRPSVREHISETTRPIFAPVFFRACARWSCVLWMKSLLPSTTTTRMSPRWSSNSARLVDRYSSILCHS